MRALAAMLWPNNDGAARVVKTDDVIAEGFLVEHLVPDLAAALLEPRATELVRLGSGGLALRSELGRSRVVRQRDPGGPGLLIERFVERSEAVIRMARVLDLDGAMRPRKLTVNGQGAYRAILTVARYERPDDDG